MEAVLKAALKDISLLHTFALLVTQQKTNSILICREALATLHKLA